MKTRLPSTLGRFVALFLVVGAFACGDGETKPKPPSNRPPEVLGDIPPVTLTEGDEFQRSVAELFSDPDGDALTYSATSSNSGVVTASMSGAIITVEAVTEGTATVTVTATDPDGASASLAVSFTVLAANRAPVVTDTIPPQNLTEGDTVTLDVSGNFSDPDGDELTFTVESTNTDAATATIDGSMVTVVGVAAGAATVAVTATDPDDAFALQEVMVTVEAANRAPVVTDTIPPQNLTEGDTVTLDVSGNFSDPDGDELTFTVESTNTDAATATIDGSMVTVVGVAAGAATVAVTATDPDDAFALQEVMVTVEAANRAPVVTDTIPPQNLTEGDTVTLDVSGNFSDPDGDELTFTVESTNTDAATATIDGSMVTVVGVAAGAATVAVTATDPDDAFALQEVMVTVEAANRAPVVTDTIPPQNLTEGDTVTLDVSGNFSDPDGDELTFTVESTNTDAATATIDGSMVTVVGVAAGAATVAVTATDPDDAFALQEVMVTVEAANRAPVVTDTIPPQNLTEGDTVTLDVSGNFSDPDDDELIYMAASSDDDIATASVSGAEVTVTGVAAGSATVTVTATDPGDLSATQTFDVTVVLGNQAPVAVGEIEAQAVEVGESATVDVSGNFSDPDDDELIYMAASSDDDIATASVSGAEVTVTGVAAGSATVTVTATDPGDLSATQTFDVTVVLGNQAPVAVGEIEAQAVEVGESATVDVSGNFSDPDDDELIYMAASSDDDIATASVSGAEVTVTGVAAGSATVTVTATDPGDLSATQTFDVTVVLGNQAPVAVGEIEAQAVEVGESATVDVSGNFSDPDDDELIYMAASSDDDIATASVSGAEVTVTGVAAGSATVTVTATDPGDLSATQTFDVTVVLGNQAPVAVGEIEAQAVEVGESATVDVSGNFSDPDDDELIYMAASSDDDIATASVSGAEVTVTGVAAGSATVTVTATDPGDLSATQTFDVTVVLGNQAPVAVGEIEAQAVEVGESATVDVSGNFSDPDDDELIYMAASSDDDIATASVSGAEVTVTGVAAGSATVTVTATDPGDLSATQTFDVTVVLGNQAPVAVGEIEAQAVEVGESATVDVSGNFSDPDDDELIYMAASSDDDIATASVSGAEVTVTGVAAGSATVTVTATDPGDLSATQTFDVTVVLGNQAPVAVGEIEAQAVEVGESATVDVSGNFSDPDDDELIYMAASSDDDIATASVSGAEVTVTGVAAGSATVTVTATDPGDLSATQTFDVTVVLGNQAPVAVGEIEAQGVAPGESATVDVSGNFSDPDDDELIYMAASSDDDIATASVSGAEVTVTGVAAGSATVTVTATDPGDLSATQMFDVAVGNQSPEAVDTIPVHDVFIVLDTLDMTMTDTLTKVVLDMSDYFSDRDELTYTASTADDGVAMVESVGGSVVTTVAVAADTALLYDTTMLMVTATDPDGLSVTQETMVRVAASDYEAWERLKITEQGTFVFSGIQQSGCFEFNKRFIPPNVYTVHWSEWQVKKGSGWVQVSGTHKELQVCPYDLTSAPDGTYRLVGEVSIRPTSDPDADFVRSRRKSGNEIEKSDN